MKTTEAILAEMRRRLDTFEHYAEKTGADFPQVYDAIADEFAAMVDWIELHD